METHEIEKFWMFFKTIASEILDDPENAELIARLDAEVDGLGEFSWEYGPTDDGLYFCLSPNFRFDLIPDTEFAISLAPTIPNWKFVSGKPQKLEAVQTFTFLNEDGTETLVNTENWYAILYKFKDNTFDIDFMLDTHLDKKLSYLALHTAMVNLLGEINYMRKVNEVKIVEKFDSNTNQKGIRFVHLAEIII